MSKDESWREIRKRNYVIQPQLVTMKDGTKELICCGPAVLPLLISGEVTGMVKIGDSRIGICCHQDTYKEDYESLVKDS